MQEERGYNQTGGALGTGQSEDTGSQVSRTATQVKERAQDTADQAMDTAAGGMESTAGTIRDKVEGQGGIQEKAGTAIADGMDKTAQYLREHDSQAVMQDMERYVRDHPTQAVLGALAVGFIVGRIIR
jgi:ElaB/YqjD/DUF883 family membrane-anchored ribosome-binding protein